MENLTHEEIEEYKDAFASFDTDENGYMSTRELKQAMRLLGLNPTDQEIQHLINEKDCDRDGKIDLNEFVLLMEDQKKPEEAADLQMAFQVFDTDNKGYVESKEIRRCLLMLRGETKRELSELIHMSNLVDDRRISFEEFSKMLSPLIVREDAIPGS